MSQKWERLIEEGERLLKEREFSSAGQVFEKALREAEKRGDAEMRVDSLQLLAMAHLECGFKNEAEELARRAAEITKMFEGEKSREYGQSQQFLADLLTDMDELKRAEEIASIGAGIIEETVSSHDCDSCRSALMQVYNLHLEILLREGKFEQARSRLRQMWEISGQTDEFKDPPQERLQDFLREYKVQRALGKSWQRQIRQSV